jgi:hypothetical protein
MPTMTARRPHLEIVSPGASPEEAAAVVAAVDRFLRDTALPVVAAEPARDAWTRAARLEGVGYGVDEPVSWG